MVEKGQLETIKVNNRERITDRSIKSLMEAAGGEKASV
jgi:hypothetical protein